MTAIQGCAAVLAATAGHPYARFATATAGKIHGLRATDAVLWLGDTPYGTVGHGLGDPSTLEELLAQARADGLLDGAGWVNLPRRVSPPPGYLLNEHWDLRWIDGAVPPQPAEDVVVALDDSADAAITALLDVAMPETLIRPRSPQVLGWFGVWCGEEVVACAADRSAPGLAEGAQRVGVLGGVAVHPRHRRRGLGAAVSARVTRHLQQRHDLVVLGVADGNDQASRVYERLGFINVHRVTSVRP